MMRNISTYIKKHCFISWTVLSGLALLLDVSFSQGATITSTATGGVWATGSTWVGGVAPSTTDDVVIVTTGSNSVALGAAATCTGIFIDSGATLTVGAYAITVNGITSIFGTLNISSATGAKAFNGDITISSGGVWNETAAATVSCSGNFINNATTFTSSTGVHTFSGTSKTFSGTTFTVIPSLAITGTYTNYGTLIVGTALSGTGGLTNGETGVLNIGGTSAITTLTATASGNVVNFNAGGNQTACKVTTYDNLTLSNSGTKTFATTPTVNAVLSMEGTATVVVTSGVITYGGSATLRYNTTTARTVTAEEWITPFAATGGVIIDNTGVITQNNAKTFSASVPLTINDGATLNAVAFSNVPSSSSIVTINGTLRTANTTGFSGVAGAAISSTNSPTITLGANSTIEYTVAAGGQTITGRSYNHLKLDNTSGTNTANGNISVDGTFTTTAGGTVSMATYTLSASTVAHAGILTTQNTSATPLSTGKTWGGTVNYNATTAGQTVVAGIYSILTMGNTSGTQTAGGDLAVTTLNNNTNAADILDMGTYALVVTTPTNAGTIRTQNISATPLTTGKTWGGTVIYNATSGGQKVVAGAYAALTMGNTSGTQTAGGNISVSGALTVGNSIFDMSTYNVTNVGSVNLTGSTIQGSGLMTLGGGVTTNANASTSIISIPIALGAATRTFTVADGTAADDLSITSIISGTVGLTESGAGVLNLSGANTYTGVTIINAGTLQLGASSSLATSGPLGTSGSGTTVSATGAALDLNGFSLTGAATEALSLTGTGVSSGGALTNTGGDASYVGAITVAATSTILANTSGTLTVSGNISGNVALTLDGSGIGTLSGVRSGNGSATIAKAGSGTWTLTGASTYTGATTINTGTLKLGLSSALTASGPLGTGAGGTTVALGAVLDLNGFSLTGTYTEALSLTGTGIGGLGALTNSSSTPSTYVGVITFTNAASIVGEGGTIAVTGIPASGTTAITLGGSAGGSVSTAIAGVRTLTKEGTGTWTLSGANTYSGATTISTGTLKLGASSTLAASGPLGSNGAGTTVSATGAALDLNGYSLTSAATETLSLSGTGIGNLGALTNSSSTTSTYIGVITFATDASIVGAGGLIAVTGIPASGTTAITLGGSVGGSVSTAIAGARALTKEGTGTWTLSGNSTYTGLTTISAGTLKLGATGTFPNGPLGTTGAGTTVSATGAALDLSGFSLATTEALTLNGTGVSSGGALINSGAAVNYTGAITLGSASSIGTAGNITLGSAGISGAQDLTKVGAATLSLGSGTATLGSLTISAGTLTSTSVTMNLAGDFSNGSTFTHNSGTVNFNGGSSQSIGGNNSSTFNNLTIANTSGGVSLGKSETVAGTLTLTSGILTTDATNLLSVTNTATSAVSAGSTSKFIKGPMKWSLGVGTYLFPVGKSTSNYFPFTLAVSAASSPIVTVEAFDTDVGGSATFDASLSSISHTEYWQATLNSGTLTGKVSLTRQLALTNEEVIGKSTLPGGIYSSIGGTAASPSINSSNSISSFSSFVMATSMKDCPVSTGVTPSADQTVCQGTATNQLTAVIKTSGGSGAPTLQYQWYYNTNNSNTIAGASLITGGTSATYTPLSGLPEAGTTRYYFCVGYASDNTCGQTNATQSQASNTVKVTIQAINALVTDVSVEPSGTDCPDFINFNGNAAAYNPGISEIKFKVERQLSTANWGFDFVVTGTNVTVSSFSIAGDGVAPTPSPNSGTGNSGSVDAKSNDYLIFTFQIDNKPGQQLNVTFTVTNVADTSCSETNTADNDKTHNLELMPEIGQFQ